MDAERKEKSCVRQDTISKDSAFNEAGRMWDSLWKDTNFISSGNIRQPFCLLQ